MNETELSLYKEWREIEGKLQQKVIQYSDVEKAKKIRLQVWEEIRNFLSIEERFELGSSLEKPLKEIFDIKYPPENWSLAKQWGTKAIHRASSGLHFLLECLEKIHRGSTDPAYSRSAYILLSVNCEMLFTAYLLLLLKDEYSRKTETELVDMLRGKHNHDLKELTDKLSKEDLNKLGIGEIRSETKNNLKRYVIILANEDKVIVEDSVTVRYDFKYDVRRDIDPEESERMKKETWQLLRMTREVMNLIPKIDSEERQNGRIEIV